MLDCVSLPRALTSERGPFVMEQYSLEQGLDCGHVNPSACDPLF
jgi:hypothetical protein